MGIKSSNTSESYYNRFMNSGKGAASPAPIPFTATGGTTHTPGNGYKYHVFDYWPTKKKIEEFFNSDQELNFQRS